MNRSGVLTIGYTLHQSIRLTFYTADSLVVEYSHLAADCN